MSESETQNGWYAEDAATFGDRLAAAREQSGLTQKTLAQRLGVKTAVIAAWEDDVKEPRANRLTMLSGMLGISLSWLMTGQGEGPDAPDDENPATPEVADIMAKIRDVRADMIRASDKLGHLEKQLRTALKAT